MIQAFRGANAAKHPVYYLHYCTKSFKYKLVFAAVFIGLMCTKYFRKFLLLNCMNCKISFTILIIIIIINISYNACFSKKLAIFKYKRPKLRKFKYIVP